MHVLQLSSLSVCFCLASLPSPLFPYPFILQTHQALSEKTSFTLKRGTDGVEDLNHQLGAPVTVIQVLLR